jgi:ribonuclease HI
VLQWNANGIGGKVGELMDRLERRKIDVVLIQETKLRSKDTAPRFPGYAAVRQDRADGRAGGGLLTLIKEDLDYTVGRPASSDVAECQCVRVRVSAARWIALHNVYAPPRRDGAAADGLDWGWLPAEANSIISGDFNAHSPLWDEQQPSDRRGETLEEWIMGSSMAILNDGSVTRVNPGTGGLSTPDVTLADSNIASACTFAVDESMGSDHLPVIVSVCCGVAVRPPRESRPKWRSKGVDWQRFTDALEQRVLAFGSRSMRCVIRRIARFSSAVVECAKQHVGKVRPGVRTRPWMTPAVKEAVKRRNRLHKEVATRRAEWVAASQEAAKLTREAKTAEWTDFLSDLGTEADPARMWRVIRGLSGTPSSSPPNEALVHDGRAVTCDRRKADLFANHYASVNRLTFTKEERARNRQCKAALRATTGAETCAFSMTELETAIGKMRTKGAPGPDDISPALIKAFGAAARAELLRICNQSLAGGGTPQDWRRATIVPLLKSGKPASVIDSFRPVSLTSCLVKVLERMIGARLYHHAESRGFFAPEQAGFRQHYCCEDQVLRITQTVSDGFQQRPPARSAMALLDYSRAYDRVWREDLLLTLLDAAVPAYLVRWIAGFLQGRQARVMLNGSLSKKVHLRQGLPQGSVLAPCLFLYYINGLASVVPEGVTLAMYADDVALLAQHRVKDRACAALQEAVTNVEEWSRAKKMTLSTSKSEVAAFSSGSSDAAWRPEIRLGDSLMPFTHAPKFLGVLLDRSLSFGRQVEEVCRRVSVRSRAINALANRDWGWRKHLLRRVFITFQLPLLTYSAAAWHPFLSSSNMDALDRAQNRVLRAITGQLSSTPLEALRLEAGVSSLRITSKRLALTAMEKALRLPATHPRAIAASQHVQHRLVRPSWRSAVSEWTAEIPAELHNRLPLTTSGPPPWHEPRQAWELRAELDNDGGNSNSNSGKRRAAANTIRAKEAELVIYTDGSAEGGISNGGAAFVVTSGDPDSPTIVETRCVPGRRFTCSYEEEVAACEAALRWLMSSSSDVSAVIATDSQAMVTALQHRSRSVLGILQLLADHPVSGCIQWVPAHCGLPGNEAADAAAKAAASLSANSTDGHEQPISYSTAINTIRRPITDGPISHQRTAAVYAALSDTRDSAQLSCRSELGPTGCSR